MDLTGNSGALLFSYRLQIGGEGAQPLMRFPKLLLGPPMLYSVLSLAYSAVHRRNKARQPCLQDVIGRAALKCFNGDFLTHGAGDKDKGSLGTLFLRQSQSIVPIEPR